MMSLFLLTLAIGFLLASYGLGRRPPLTPAQEEQGVNLQDGSHSQVAVILGLVGFFFAAMALITLFYALHPPPPGLGNPPRPVNR